MVMCFEFTNAKSRSSGVRSLMDSSFGDMMTDDASFLSLIGLDVAKRMGRTIQCWCGETSELVRLHSKRMVYVCFHCLTKHGAHQFSPYDPLGFQAEPDVRRLRRRC